VHEAIAVNVINLEQPKMLSSDNEPMIEILNKSLKVNVGLTSFSPAIRLVDHHLDSTEKGLDRKVADR
jgi:hypothetical protein